MNYPIKELQNFAAEQGVRVEITKVPAGGYELRFPMNILRERTMVGAKTAIRVAAGFKENKTEADLA